MQGYKTLSVSDFEKTMVGEIDNLEELFPAFDKMDAAVCIVSSDEYAPFAGIVIQSIIYNSSPEKKYDLVILSDDMTVANRRRIIMSAENYDNISVRILDISKVVKDIEFYTWAHFTKNTYYRLLTPDIFEHYHKVIYLDSDIIVNEDIAKLYDEDIDGYYMAAAYDTHVVSYCTRKPALEQREYNINTLKMNNPEEYFQCGVSLYNIDEMKKNYEKGYLIKQAQENTLRWLDQDLVNMLFYGKIKKIPNKWNVMVANIPNDLDEIHLPDDLKKEYFEARQNPYIIHYAGKAIPCFTGTPDMYEYFWKYARMSCFYEVILQKMIPATLFNDSSSENVLSDWSIIHLQHDMMFSKYEKTLSRRLKRFFDKLIQVIFPIGSRRRKCAKKICKR